MNRSAVLFNPQQAHGVWMALWAHVKAETMAGNRLEVELRQVRRSHEQNALLHALLTEIASRVEWAGKKREVEVWKRLLTAAWLRARGESLEVLPAIDGHGIDVVFRRTSDLTKGECAELITFIQAWAAEQGIETANAA